MWNPTQRIVLALTPKISSFLTFLGSSWVIVEITTSKQKLSHPYHRLLLAMSLYDVTEAIGNFMSTWPIPEQTMFNQVWAVGNQETCTTQGFVLMLAIAVPIYNAMLALYYMLVINHNFSDRTLRRYFEPTVHIVAFCWAFGTAIASTRLRLFNNSNLWCWIAPYPRDCLDTWRYGEQGNCLRGDNAWIYRWAFYFAPLWLCIVIATICTVMVYKRVRSLEEQTLRYRRPEISMSLPNLAAPNSSQRTSTFYDRMQQSRREGNLAAEEKKDDAFLSGFSSITDSSVTSQPRLWPPSGFLEGWKTRRAIYREDYRRTVVVANQSVWYLGVFYITHVWATTTRIIQQVRHGKTYFGVILFHSICDPLQGFLNFMVYQRPRYIKIRKANPDLSVFSAMWRTLRFSFLPPLASSVSVGMSRPQTSASTFHVPTIPEPPRVVPVDALANERSETPRVDAATCILSTMTETPTVLPADEPLDQASAESQIDRSDSFEVFA